MTRFLFVLIALTFVMPALAQQKEPLTVSATGTLEWHRNSQQYVATGSVVAKQGTTEIRADRMVADYREGQKSASALWQLTAEGNVTVLNTGGTKATGDRAVYNLDEKKAVLTGQTLTLTTPEQTVTATDRFEYWPAEGRAVAVGKAKVVQADDTIAADTLSAWFKDNGKGARTLDRAEANGNVVITTPTETATGSSGTYTAANNTAVLMGPVTILRESGKLQGGRAEVNLQTNVSTMYADKKGGRVTGTFIPGSPKK